MSVTPPTGISRTFRDLSDKELAEAETASLLSRWGVSRGVGWDDLLKSRRILIVSEAGVGKTFECRACRDRLMANGEPAFVLELSTLADLDVREMLDPEEQARFSAASQRRSVVHYPTWRRGLPWKTRRWSSTS